MSRRYSRLATVLSRSVRPGWPATKTSSPSLDPFVLHFRIVLELRRLAVLVGAEEADVEVVARVLEVVRIAAEEGDVELGGEHQADVGVFLVAYRGDTARPGRG